MMHQEMDAFRILQNHCNNGNVPARIAAILNEVILKYLEASKSIPSNKAHTLLCQFIDMTVEQIKNPYRFLPYHKKLKEPCNYFAFANDFIRPLIDFENSKVYGREHVKEMITFMKEGGNVILYANHQTEPDPQIIYLLLENEFPQFAENMIFVAGHRVTTDPLAIPFSMGTDLLCIYSKRHIENPPEQKEVKLGHNKHVMNQMKLLLSEGSKCIYVAPSGGRDRLNDEGKVGVAPFDPNSVEMFRLMAKSSRNKTRFYPLALWTYPLMPPPDRIERDLHERRILSRTAVYLSFGDHLNIDSYCDDKTMSKHEQRAHLANDVWKKVTHLYQKFEIGV